MTTLKFRAKLPKVSREIKVQCFAGVDKGHLQLAGNLLLHTQEWQLLGAALLLGAEKTNGELEVIIEES